MSLKNISLDIDFVRSQFPAFNDPLCKDWSFFENYISGTWTQFPYQFGSKSTSPGPKIGLKMTLWEARMGHVWESPNK